MFYKKNLLAGLLAVCVLLSPLSSLKALASSDAMETIYEYDKLWNQNGQFDQKVFQVGFRLLNASDFPRNVHFFVKKTKKDPDAFAMYLTGKIYINSSFFPYMDNDDELAALLAHELIHIDQLSTGFWPWKRLKMVYAPKYYEHDADLRGVDMMVKAGYNPLAMITLWNKISPEYSAFLKVMLVTVSIITLTNVYTHPTCSTRIEKIYDHIRANYPQFLADNYKNNPYYRNFLLNYEKDTNIKKLKNKYSL